MDFQICLTQLLIINTYQDLLLKNGLKFRINQKEIIEFNKEIRVKTPTLRSDLCDFSDEFIVVKGTITVANPNNAKRNKAMVFKK